MRKYKSPERWKCIPGYNGKLFVSNYGQVKYVFKNGRESIKTQKVFKNGYAYISTKVHGKIKRLLVHRLVAEAFLVKASDGLEVNHKDHNKLNNNVKNLEWVTHRQNMQLWSMYRKYGYRKQVDKKIF